MTGELKENALIQAILREQAAQIQKLSAKLAAAKASPQLVASE